MFTGSSRVVEKHADVTVYIDGTQFSDGHAERNVTVHQLDADDPLTVEQARRLAQALIALQTKPRR